MSAAIAAAAAAASGARCYSSSKRRSGSGSSMMDNNSAIYGGTPNQQYQLYATTRPTMNRYESQKQRDWNAFGQYRRTQNPPLTLSKCGSEHVFEFIRYLGETNYYQASSASSLDGIIGRLRVAFEENGGRPETNPFGGNDVRLYLSQVKDAEAKARRIA